MDINEEINYVWQFGWDKKGYGESRPIVNRLLRAIIEKNTHIGTSQMWNKNRYIYMLFHISSTLKINTQYDYRSKL